MDYKNVSDLELWQYCREDDKKAYTELFDRYFPKIYRLASRNISESVVAEELSMDLFFNLWQKRHQIIITGNVSAYLFRSIKNLVINELQKGKPVAISVDLLNENTLISTISADQGILSSEMEHMYQVGLNKLSAQRHKVFQLSREENMTYSEIAREMNLSVHTVKNYINAALMRLRQSINDYTATNLLMAGLSLLSFF